MDECQYQVDAGSPDFWAKMRLSEKMYENFDDNY